VTREPSVWDKSDVFAEPNPLSSGTSGVMLKQDQILADKIVQRARAAWPELNVPVEPFAQRAVALADSNAPPKEVLKTLAVEDLFLAHACAQGDQVALKAFAKECDGDLRSLAIKLKISDSDFDDIRQRLWDKLFLVAPDHSKKILEYRGEGKLRHWFRVLAARTMLDDLRKAKRGANRPFISDDNALWSAAPDVDPELGNIRQQYKDAFRCAFENAVRGLEPEERNILRCHYLLGMSSEQMAQAFGTHKATAARHVARAREKLLQFTRDRLKVHLGADSGELDSVMRLFDGEMSVSLSRLLK
jgi:RNA polymerase sigma-70 factor (ECF subfamily)